MRQSSDNEIDYSDIRALDDDFWESHATQEVAKDNRIMNKLAEARMQLLVIPNMRDARDQIDPRLRQI